MRVAVYHPQDASPLGRVLADGLCGALGRLGHSATLCETSDTVAAFSPALVMVADPSCAKLCDYFTVGFVWQSLPVVEQRTAWHGTIVSWDLAVCTDPAVRQFLRDIHFPARGASAVSELTIHPTIELERPAGIEPGSTVAVLRSEPLFETPGRDKAVFGAIAALLPMRAYGPAELWEWLGEGYAGPLPNSTPEATALLAEHRAVLAFDRFGDDLTLFLAAGAGRPVVVNLGGAGADLVGGGVLRVDVDRDPAYVAKHIATSLDGLAASRPATSHLHGQLTRLLDEVAALRRDRTIPHLGTISVIIRCGGRPLAFLQRAVESARQQTYPDIALLFVAYASVSDIEAYASALERDARWASVRCIGVAAGSRSATLWAGLQAVDTPLFCLLDDDDEWFHDHLATLTAALDGYGQAMVAHSGTIRAEEWCFPPDPSNPSPVGDERKALLYIEPFDVETAIRLDHKIQSNAWLARTPALHGPVREDPRLNYAEDIYLFMLLVARHPYVFTGRATAVYNWRTGQVDSSRSEPVAQNVQQSARMLLRLMRVPFLTPRLGATLHRRNAASEHASDIVLGSPIPYESALETGIDFARTGLPAFVSAVSGLSSHEEWGRWTIGPLLRITFRGPLPDTFNLALHAHASEPNVGLPVVITVGECRQEACFSLDRQELVLPFVRTGSPRDLTIAIPNPRMAGPVDTRLIGLGLIHLAILPGADGS